LLTDKIKDLKPR